MKFLPLIAKQHRFFFHYRKTAVREHLKAHIDNICHDALHAENDETPVDLLQGVWTEC